MDFWNTWVYPVLVDLWNTRIYLGFSGLLKHLSSSRFSVNFWNTRDYPGLKCTSDTHEFIWFSEDFWNTCVHHVFFFTSETPAFITVFSGLLKHLRSSRFLVDFWNTWVYPGFHWTFETLESTMVFSGFHFAKSSIFCVMFWIIFKHFLWTNVCLFVFHYCMALDLRLNCDTWDLVKYVW